MLPSPLFTALKEVAQHLGDRLDKILAELKNTALVQSLSALILNQTKALEASSKRIENALTDFSKTPISADVTVDTSALEKQMAGARVDIRELKLPSMKTVETLLAVIASDIAALKAKETPDGTDKVVGALSGIKTYDTVKIDSQQMMAITGSMRGGSAGASVPAATRVSNTTVAATLTNTEYSYKFPSGTVGWLIKTRDQGTLGYYSWTTGKLPSSGDASTYMTIPQNFLRSQEHVDYSDKTIYLGADTASTVFEIELFRV